MGDYGSKGSKGSNEYQKRRNDTIQLKSGKKSSLKDEIKDILGTGRYSVNSKGVVTITYPSGGRLVFKRDYYQTPDERIPNRITYAKMAEQYGESYELLDQMKDTVTYVDKNGKEKHSNPDARRLSDGVYSDAKHPDPTRPITNNIKNGIRSAMNQVVVNDVIIRVNGKASNQSIKDGFHAGFGYRNNTAIGRVVILDDEGKRTYNRREIDAILNRTGKA